MTLCSAESQSYRFESWALTTFRVIHETGDNLTQTFHLRERKLSLTVLHHYIYGPTLTPIY